MVGADVDLAVCVMISIVSRGSRITCIQRIQPCLDQSRYSWAHRLALVEDALFSLFLFICTEGKKFLG